MSRKSVGDIIRAPLSVFALANGAAAGLTSIWNMVKAGAIPRLVIDVFLVAFGVLLFLEVRSVLRQSKEVEGPVNPPGGSGERHEVPVAPASRVGRFQEEIERARAAAAEIQKETRERYK